MPPRASRRFVRAEKARPVYVHGQPTSLWGLASRLESSNAGACARRLAPSYRQPVVAMTGSTCAAQNLNPGIFPKGSRSGLVNVFAGASA